ncbi:MAG: transcription antitermination factor NusB [Spirochaetota bacterium]
MKKNKPAMSTRHQARELAISYLFSWDFHGGGPLPEEIEFPCKSEEELEAFDLETRVFASYLVRGTIEHIDQIDEIIKKHTQHRSFDRIERISKNILRLSIFSLLYTQEMHPSIVIDEAVKLSIEYSNDVSYKYINGLLEAVKTQEL